MVPQFELPELPYGYDALEPVISREIMTLHHDKHHAGYVTNLNKALVDYAEAEKKKDLTAMISLEPAIRFNGGGHINHSIFWTNLAPKDKGGGLPPKGPLESALTSTFGSLATFIEKFNAKTVAIQGSGWGWLALCPGSKRLSIITCANQDPCSTTGLVPLLGIDVWEHAYYIDYKNVRAEYLKKIWEIVNWQNVAERYEKAIK